jgi:hypothetical protein
LANVHVQALVKSHRGMLIEELEMNAANALKSPQSEVAPVAEYLVG